MGGRSPRGIRLAAAAGVALAAASVASGEPTRSFVPATITVSVTGDGVVRSDGGAIDCGTRCTAQAEVGSAIRLVASPASGRMLAGWDGACTGRALSCDLVVDGATDVRADFTNASQLPQPTPLDVTRSDGGSIVSEPEGIIDCGTRCSTAWPAGGQITLRARASAGFRFVRWLRSCNTTDDACRLDLSAERDATALFERTSIPSGSSTLTLRNRDAPGSGSNTSGTVLVEFPGHSEVCDLSECTYTIANGTQVVLTPDSGTLQAWEGGCVGTGPECRIVIAGNVGVTVDFRPGGPRAAFGVNVSRAGRGRVTSVPTGIDCGPSPSCAAAFGDRTPVRLTATEAAGWRFAGWTGDCAGTAACSVVADATRSVTAVFRLARRTLRVELAGRGRGTVRSTPDGIACRPDCEFAFPDGGSVTLTAVPEAGSSFGGWTGACTGQTCTVSIGADAVARALFHRCATLDFRGFVAQVLRGPRRVRIALVLTGPANVRVVVLRGRRTVKQLRTGRLAPGTRRLTLVLPARGPAGRHTVRATVVDACGGTRSRTRNVRIR